LLTKQDKSVFAVRRAHGVANLTTLKNLPQSAKVMAADSSTLHPAVVEHMDRRAVSLPLAQPMPVNVIYGVLVDAVFDDPFSQ
jgi:hypothetical protein